MGPRRIFTENYVPNHYLGAPREHFVFKTRTSGRLYHSRLHSDEHFALKTRTRGRLYRSRLHSGDHFGLKIRTRGRLYHSRLHFDEHFGLKISILVEKHVPESDLPGIGKTAPEL